MDNTEKMNLLKAYCYDNESVIVCDYMSGNVAMVYDESNYSIVVFSEKYNDWTEVTVDEEYNYILERYEQIVCDNT